MVHRQKLRIQHVDPQKGIILKGNIIFQPSILRGYVSFQGSNDNDAVNFKLGLAP